MSILVEALSVVIPRHVLDAGYPGGTEGYLETARRARGARYAISDERLACVSFASPTDADAFTAPLSALGLGAEDGAPPPVACLDEDFGPTAACPWLRWRRHDDGFTSCWLEWTEPGELAAPRDWLPPRQRSQSARPVAARSASLPPASATASADVAPAASTAGPEMPPPLRIVPTAIGPLTPISSPAILAAMEGIPSSNGHAFLDADSIDVDSLVATAEDAFSELDYGTAGSGVVDEDAGDEWSLPEFEPGDVDAAATGGQPPTEEANETTGGLSAVAENAEAVLFAPAESAVDDSLVVQGTAAAEDFGAVEAASPFEYSPAVQNAAVAHDFMALDDVMSVDDVMALEDIAAGPDVMTVQDVQPANELIAGPAVVEAEDDWTYEYAVAPVIAPEAASVAGASAVDEYRIDDGAAEQDDADHEATSYIAEDDMSYDDLADVDALLAVVAESSEPVDAEAPIWSDEIAAEPIATANHQDNEALPSTEASTVAFDDVDALFAARDHQFPASLYEASQSVASASADDDTARIPASLTPVAMTAVSVSPSPVAAYSAGTSLDAVRAHLAERGWRYSQDADQGALFYQTAGGRASYPGFAAADESAQLVWLYTQIPVRVPEHRRAAAVELLTRANHGLAVGNFEFDYTDGEVRFKAVADSADGCFTAAAAGRLLRHSLEACDRYHDSLMQVIYGGLSPAEAVR